MAGDRESDEALGHFIIGLRTRGYRSSRLLEAVERAPRAEFVAREHIAFAYKDMSLPLPCGQETGRPLAVIEAVSALKLERGNHVLEIGTGSGWQTALIACLSGAVASVERWLALAEAADARLVRFGLANAVVVHGDGAGGVEDAGPFDRIIYNAAVTRVPESVAAQLAPGGVILAPIAAGAGRRLMRFAKQPDGDLAAEDIGPSEAPLLASGAGDGA
jgi:protein-L-isoaspartate(D-aspartate) O-methyltransferase